MFLDNIKTEDLDNNIPEHSAEIHRRFDRDTKNGKESKRDKHIRMRNGDTNSRANSYLGSAEYYLNGGN